MPTMPDVPLPINVYDVTTTNDPPVALVSCRNANDAQSLANQLQQWQADGRVLGVSGFTVASPRVVTVNVPLQTGTTVTVQGVEVNVDAAAQIFIDAANAAAQAALDAANAAPPEEPTP